MKLLQRLGQGFLGILGLAKKTRISPLAREQERFVSDVREQFVKLKEKGISISVFTL